LQRSKWWKSQRIFSPAEKLRSERLFIFEFIKNNNITIFENQTDFKDKSKK